MARATFRPARGRDTARRYGLPADAFAALVASQDSLCAVCGEGLRPGRTGHTVDHCHQSQRTRGVLCRGCNLGLGNFKDSIPTLRSAITYLELHRTAQET